MDIPSEEAWLAEFEGYVMESGAKIKERTFERPPDYCSWEIEIPGGSTFHFAIALRARELGHSSIEMFGSFVAKAGVIILEARIEEQRSSARTS